DMQLSRPAARPTLGPLSQHTDNEDATPVRANAPERNPPGRSCRSGGWLMSLPQREPHFAEDVAEPLPAREARATLEQLYREHGGGVLTLCSHLLRDRGEAEDAAQQSFVSAFRALLAGTVPRDDEAWLRTIARNECWARSGRGVVVPLSERLEAPPGADPVAAAIRGADFAAVWTAIAELPTKQRSALLLREVRGLTYDELADDLRTSRHSVRSLLLRARHTVRARLEKGAAAIGG